MYQISKDYTCENSECASVGVLIAYSDGTCKECGHDMVEAHAE